MKIKLRQFFLLTIAILFAISHNFMGQGVTKAYINGFVFDTNGKALPGANVIAVHVPTGTRYGAATRGNGVFNLPNVRIGGPYTVTVSYIGFDRKKEEGVFLNIGQTLRMDFRLSKESLQLGELVVTADKNDLMNSDRTGAATFINPDEIKALPSIKRSIRDLTRLDPRSDGNFSFSGKNWLYNNYSVDGSYFNNPFGLDNPSPGGQSNAEPLPYDAVEQVQVSIAPYDVREGGFTGAGINTVTKSGTNDFKGSIYTFFRNESMQGDKVGDAVILNPELKFNQYGASVSGPIIKNKLFFFVNGEIERRDDPGTNFSADTDGDLTNNGAGVSRVQAEVMDRIRQRMIDVYDYDPGAYQGFNHRTNNEKILIKLDWNINDQNNLTLRYNYLNALRDKAPHPFAISYNNTGRGPNQNSLPFQNSGYTINNQLSSFALELNSQFKKYSNNFFVSYNSFRDFREPFSKAFPTIEISEGGLTYTTVGHEPFSIHNILDQDVLQITDNFNYYLGNHVLTVGASFEYFKFFNSFNLFRHGKMGFNTYRDIDNWNPVKGLPTTFLSVQDFMDATNPNNTVDFIDFKNAIESESLPFKGEFIEVGQLSFYAQDEFLASDKFSLTYGVRVDVPTYFTEPVDNPFSRGLNLLDENDKKEVVDQSKLPDATPMFSPRVGFNWDVHGDKSAQLRGGTGIFTGRIPFVWIGNNISNPGANPNLPPSATGEHIKTDHDSELQQSFDLNAMSSDFKWPQVWTTNLAMDHKLPGNVFAILEAVYSKDINSVYVRNADLTTPARHLADGRPYFTDASGNRELNPDGAGAFIIDNSDEGSSLSITAQLRKTFEYGLSTSFAYSYLSAKNLMNTTEIASILFNGNPIQGDPNNPEVANSQFGQQHRIIGGANYKHNWSNSLATTFGVFFEAAEGNRFTTSGGNRYSFIYAGDVNGDGSGGNDLIYIPKDANDINLADPSQWNALNDFIEQDEYLSKHRGEIAERNGLVNPWYFNIDLRILQDFTVQAFGKDNTLQLSVDVLNVANLISSSWGVRQVASPAATSPLQLDSFGADGEPIFNFNGVQKTFVDDPGLFSRWQMQVGLRYMFN
ncbi:MAG: carboxypeptidase regulatory-like domain-containing protein [Melioribacteraceae bacterium]